MGIFDRIQERMEGAAGLLRDGPSVPEATAQIRKAASKLSDARAYSDVTSLLDPMCDLYKRTKNPAVAGRIADWTHATARSLERGIETGVETMFDSRSERRPKLPWSPKRKPGSWPPRKKSASEKISDWADDKVRRDPMAQLISKIVHDPDNFLL